MLICVLREVCRRLSRVSYFDSPSPTPHLMRGIPSPESPLLPSVDRALRAWSVASHLHEPPFAVGPFGPAEILSGATSRGKGPGKPGSLSPSSKRSLEEEGASLPCRGATLPVAPSELGSTPYCGRYAPVPLRGMFAPLLVPRSVAHCVGTAAKQYMQLRCTGPSALGRIRFAHGGQFPGNLKIWAIYSRTKVKWGELI